MSLVAVSIGLAAAIIAFVIARAFAKLGRARRVQPAATLPLSTVSVARRTLDVAPPYTLVESRHGWMLVNRNDFYLGQAILQYGECCEIEIAFLVQLLSTSRPGLLVEVGANIGTHSVPLARTLAAQKRRMVVIEPQPFIFQNLCANLALNGITNVRALPVACGESDSTLYFSLPDYVATGNFGGVSMALEPIADGVSVPCRRLDDLLDGENVALMKIDVEGFELRALRGAEATIDRSRPILYVENDRAEQSADLIEWIWAKDYRIWWHAPLLYNSGNFFANEDDIYPSVISVNMVCVPREFAVPAMSGVEEIIVNRHLLDRTTFQELHT